MNYEIRIAPKSDLVLVDVPELWRYRDLISLLVWRDFSVKYKQTILGPIWFILQPLLPTLVFTLIFGKVAGMSTDGVPGFLFFLCNQIVWGYFSNNYTSTATCLVTNLHLFTKVHLPKLVVPVAGVLSNSLSITIQLLLFVVSWMWFRFMSPAGEHLHFTTAILLAPLVFLLAAIQGLAFGFVMAALTAKYRDLQQLSSVLIQLWMYGSAVIFPLSQVPKKYQTLVSLNPVTFVTEAFRVCLLGVGTISWAAGLYSVIISLVVLVGGLYLFNKTSRAFVDIA